MYTSQGGKVERSLGAYSKLGLAKRSSPSPETPSLVGRDKEGERGKAGKGLPRKLEEWLLSVHSRTKEPRKGLIQETERHRDMGEQKSKEGRRKESKEENDDAA